MKRSFGSPVLDVVSRLLMPFLVVFAVYVILHGHESPGGGFQGGVLLAGAVILVRLVRGRETDWGLQRRGALFLAAFGVFLYAAVGFAALLFNGNFLDYSALPFPAEWGHHRALGTLIVEIAVACGVMGVMLSIFDCLLDQEERLHDR